MVQDKYLSCHMRFGTSYLECLCKTLMNLDKHILDIVQKGVCRWDVVSRSTCLHKTLKATVVNNCKRSVVFCDPANKFSAANSSISDI
jgi:hypothetical protein